MKSLNDRLTEYGFYVWETGGGCSALRKDFPDGCYLLLTDDADSDLGTGQNVIIGFHSRDGESWHEFDAKLI